MDNKIILALLMLPSIGKITALNILKYQKDIIKNEYDIFESIQRYRKTNMRIKSIGLDEIHIACDRAKSILNESRNNDIGVLNYFDAEYPELLRQIKVPPVLLYYKGNIDLLKHDRNVAVVGTRDISEHGEKAARRLSHILSRENCCIVSGLAIGTDTIGHKSCLERGGSTIAILPSPLNRIIPNSNRDLAKRIVKNNGLIISEYYIGQEISSSFYAERNRLQSGISKAVIVIESYLNGGTLITADYAIKQNRILACYRHPEKYSILEQAQGNQMLIKEKNAYVIDSKESIEKLVNKLDDTRLLNVQLGFFD